MRAKFFGGSLDGKERDDVPPADRYIHGPVLGVRETYVRAGSNRAYGPDPDGPHPNLVLFYKIVSMRTAREDQLASALSEALDKWEGWDIGCGRGHHSDRIAELRALAKGTR